MDPISPRDLVLRCYGRPIAGGRWYGVCLEFDLSTEAGTPDELKLKLKDMIESYLESVLDTSDHASIPELLSRRAPLRDWLTYYALKIMGCIVSLPVILFKESLPVHLAKSCC